MGDSDAAGTVRFDAAEDSLSDLLDVTGNVDFIVNAIGIIKSYIEDGVPSDAMRALRVNSLVPHELARIAEPRGINVIQIATDCVYSGSRGSYIRNWIIGRERGRRRR